jgi:predicted ester cyclase
MATTIACGRRGDNRLEGRNAPGTFALFDTARPREKLPICIASNVSYMTVGSFPKENGPIRPGANGEAEMVVLGPVAIPVPRWSEKVTTDVNKRLIQRLIDEVVNAGRVEAVGELVSADYYDHQPLPGTSPDVNGLKQRFAVRAHAFPDFRATILDLVSEGDKVALIMSGTGTHMGELMGAPPTGKHFTILEMHLFRVRDGKLVEHWGLTDFFSMLEQLGLIAAPWAAAAEA